MSNGVLYDNTKCIGCRSCQVACKQWNNKKAEETVNTGEYQNPPHLSSDTYTLIRFKEIEYNGKFQWVFNKVQCMHCVHPACKSACPVYAFQKQDNGPVVYDDNRCFGCRYCMVACPFGIPTYQWENPLPWVRKCTFCADRQSGGLEPSCVTACPTGALKFGPREDLIAEAHERIANSNGKYVDHLYGEHEVGGTEWLYLSSVPFEELGFPTLGTEAVAENANITMRTLPYYAFGVAAIMAGIYWVTRRRKKLSEAETGSHGQEKEEVTK
jgi:formate dehydrogenase iron-sulfur subunit